MTNTALGGYSHCALLYDDPDELTTALAEFVSDGIAMDETVMVVVDGTRGAMLLDRLGTATGFTLADSADVYTSPTRTLAAYIAAVEEGTSGGRPIRVAGEPIWIGRSPVELQEWGCVESACNAAFASSTLTMLCPYHVAELHPEIVATARRTHPLVRTRNGEQTSPHFVEPQSFHRAARSAPLPSPATGRSHHARVSPISAAAAADQITAFGLSHSTVGARANDLAAAVDEVVAAAAAGGAPHVDLRMWCEDAAFSCDVEARWPVADFPAFLREQFEHAGEPGLWTPGQICDLIAVRERDGLTTVRLRVHAPNGSAAVATCDGVIDLLGVFVLGACAPEESGLVDRHLAQCTSCRTDVDGLAETVRAMAEAHHISGPRGRTTTEDG